MEDCPSENRCPLQLQPLPECPSPRPSTCRAITIERSHPAGCSTKSKANKNNLQSFSPNECPSSASSKPKLEQPASSKPKLEQPASLKPKLEQPSSLKLKLEQPASSTPKIELPSSLKPKLEQPARLKPKLEQPASSTPKLEQPASSKPKLEQPVSLEPKLEQPPSSKPKLEKPASLKPMLEQPASLTLILEQPVSSTPKLEQPASLKPKLEQPASSTSKLEQPASSKPKLEQPESLKPKLEQPAKIKPPPPPPLSKPTTPPEVKPIPELPPSNTQRYSLPPSATEKLQSVVAAHKEVVATLKCAARDLFCIATTSTHGAITKISNESNKHLQNIKKTVSGIIPERKEGEKCDRPAAVQKVSDIPSDMSLWQFDVVNVDTSKEKDESAFTKSQTNINEKINKAWNFVNQKVDAAVSGLSDSLCSMQWKSFNDQSSKYDVPKPRPKEVSGCPAEEEDILWHPGNFHLFSSMKDKVWGLFSDDVKTTLSDDFLDRRNSAINEIEARDATNVASENDDNIINTLTD